MKRESKRVRLAEVMRHLQGNPRTTKELSILMGTSYRSTIRYVYALINENKIEPHTNGTKPIKYRKKYEV
jgi:hypothetical protein